jgi:hypothetical protein
MFSSSPTVVRFAFLMAFKVLCCSVALAQNPLATPATIPAPAALFSEAERARIVGFWNEPNRYVLGVRRVENEGPYVVRLLPEASVWLSAYNNILRPGKQPPTQKRVIPETDTPQSKKWESWIAAKLNHDRWSAQKVADASNTQLGARAVATITAAPPLPGVIPSDLLELIGNPPAMYAAVIPRTYSITFDDGQILQYTDHVASGTSRSAYYRFTQGVISLGVRLRDWRPQELDAFFAQSGLTPFEQNVMKAVSVLEGGFDSVNTYDTGFVSVGFIQFASLRDGAGSLGAVLRRQKQTRAADFEKDFRRYGVDVDNQGTLVVVDPQTGAEVRGAQANLKIIDDKRLIAVFQRAGRTRAFQTAQIQIAKQNYYPADDRVTVNINGQDQTVKVSDLIRSEAGMATLFDRKVNTGNIRMLGGVVSRLMKERNLTQIEQLRPFEREMIPQLRWRTDFLADKSLGQP